MAAASAPALFHDVEQRFLKLSEALDAATSERDELRTASGEHEASLAKLTLSLTSSQRSEADAEEKRAAAERDAARLDGARQANAERADRAELRAAELAAAAADAHKALADARRDARAKAETCARAESQAQASTLERERWDREREALEGHAAWLKGELDARSQELREVRAEASLSLSSAELSRDEARALVASKTHLLEASEERRANAERAQTSAEASLRDARVSAASATAALEADLVAEKRLSVALVDEGDAHARDARTNSLRAEDASAREVQATRRLEEQVQAVKRECDDLLNEAREAADARLAEAHAEVEAQGKRADDAERALSAPQTADAGAARFYRRGADAERSAEAAKAELRRNELYLERVGREIEKKASVFEREVSARKDAVKAYDTLALKHHALEQERDAALKERDACRQAALSAGAEREALEATRQDLSTQVRELLKSGSNKPRKNEAGDFSDQLVAFGDIDELQLRNEQLLRVVRSLSKDVEAAKDQVDSGLLESTIQELEQLKQGRESQDAMVRALVCERDQFRNQARGLRGAQVLTTEVVVPPPDGGAIVELRADAERFRRDAQLAAAATQMARDAEGASKKEAAEARGAEARSRADLDFERSRGQRLERALNDARRGEATALQDSARKASRIEAAEVAAQTAEEDAQNARRSAAQKAEEAARADARRAAERAAGDNAQQRVRALTAENARLVDALSGLERLEAALGATREADDTQTAERLAAAEARLDTSGAELAAAHEAHRVATAALTADAAAARGEAKAADAKTAAAREAAAAAAARAEALEGQLREARSKPPSPRVFEEREAASTQDLALASVLRGDAAQLRVELDAAVAARDTERGHAETFRRIAESHESALTEATATADALRATTARERQELRATVDNLREKERNEAGENARLEERLAEARADLASVKAQRDAAEATRDDLTRARDDATRQRDAASSESERAQQAAASARDAYERELGLHAAHVAALNASVAACRAAVAEAKAARGAAPVALTPAVRGLRADEELPKRCSALERQNELLHAQVSLAAQTVERLQRRRADGATEEVDTPDADARLSELREVVVFVRREKELAEAKLAVEGRGRVRDAARAVAAEENAAGLRAERDALLRARDGTSNEGLGGDAEQRRRAAAQQLSLLRESNATLRHEASGQRAAADGLRNELRRLRAAVSDPRDRQLADLRAKAEGAEKARQASERDAAAWRRRVDALVAGGATRVDADEHRKVEEALRTAEDACDELRTRAARAVAAAKDETNAAKLLDAGWARDAARAAQRFLRDKRGEALSRRAIDEGARRARLLEDRAGAADAAARALRDEVVRAEAKVRKAAGMLRQYKAQTQALEGKVATMASPLRAAPPAAAPAKKPPAAVPALKKKPVAAPVPKKLATAPAPAPASQKKKRPAPVAAAAPAAASAKKKRPAPAPTPAGTAPAPAASAKKKRPAPAAEAEAPAAPTPAQPKKKAKKAAAAAPAKKAPAAAPAPAAKKKPAAASKKSEADALRAKLLSLQKANAAAKQKIAATPAAAPAAPNAPPPIPVLSPLAPPFAPPAAAATATAEARRKARADRFATAAGAPAPAPAAAPEEGEE